MKYYLRACAQKRACAEKRDRQTNAQIYIHTNAKRQYSRIRCLALRRSAIITPSLLIHVLEKDVGHDESPASSVSNLIVPTDAPESLPAINI